MDLSPDALLRVNTNPDVIADETRRVAEQIRLEARDIYGKSEFSVIVHTKAHPAERLEVCRNFKEAGWYRVSSRTSEENGERPGLTSYTFVRYSNQPPRRP